MLPAGSVKQTPKPPSPKLTDSVKSFASELDNGYDNWVDLCDKWERIKSDGAKEGFTENQLIQMVRPFLKERGLSKDQIYYFFHRKAAKRTSEAS